VLRLVSIAVKGERNFVAAAPPALSVGGLRTTAGWNWARKDILEMSLKELVLVGLKACVTKGFISAAMGFLAGEIGSTRKRKINLPAPCIKGVPAQIIINLC